MSSKYATVAMMAYSIYARPLTVPSMPTGTQPMHTALNQSSKLALLTNSPRKHGSEHPTCGSFPTKEHSQIRCIPSSVSVLITQGYLVATNPGVVERVRSRGQDATLLYYPTTKKPTGVCGESVEVERRISEREYLELLARKDPCRHTVVKERTCFVYRDQYFELDVFAATRLPHALLEIELLSEQQTVELPSFLDIIEEVTGDAAWSNFSIAHRLAQKD